MGQPITNNYLQEKLSVIPRLRLPGMEPFKRKGKSTDTKKHNVVCGCAPTHLHAHVHMSVYASVNEYVHVPVQIWIFLLKSP